MGVNMLTVYVRKDEVPEDLQIIVYNDAYFNNHTFIGNTPLERKILKSIDGAEYINSKVFKSRFVTEGNIPKKFLSTGSKTLINIINHPEICFITKECGNNALNFLPEISQKCSGSILMENWLFSCNENYACDFCYKGKKYQRIVEFIKAVKEELYDDTGY